MSFVLASASPRRRDILGELGVSFRVVPSDIDEAVRPGEPPSLYVARMARDKAREGARTTGGAWVLGADTVVVCDDTIVTKPADDADARAMLATLGGRAHRVLTAVALVSPASEVFGEVQVVTEVWFRPLDAATIDRYVATGEGRDKAGAYAIQGIGGGLVSRIDGSYHNVVGLPAAETLQLLVDAGVLEAWP